MDTKLGARSAAISVQECGKKDPVHYKRGREFEISLTAEKPCRVVLVNETLETPKSAGARREGKDCVLSCCGSGTFQVTVRQEERNGEN